MKPRLLSLTLFLFCLLGMGQGLSAQPDWSLQVMLSTRSWLSLEIDAELKLIDTTRYSGSLKSGLVVPVFLIVQEGGWDTWEFNLGWRQILTGTDLGWTTWNLDAEAGVHLSHQSQNLGQFFNLGGYFRVAPELRWESISLNLPLVWRTQWLTHYTPSAWVRSTFADYPGSAGISPSEGWLAFNQNILQAGLGMGVFLQNIGIVTLEGGWQGTPGSLLGGFDGMAIGEWPFWGRLGWRQSFSKGF